MAKKRNKTTDGMAILFERFVAGQPRMQKLLAEERANAHIARQIYDLRTAAGLSQAALAKRVGTTTSVICRLEDADYTGHSMSMLHRIASALEQCVEVRFVKAKRARLQPA